MQETGTKKFVDTENTFSESYKEVLSEIESEGECPAPFCKDNAEYHTNEVCKWGNWKFTENSFNYQSAKHKILIIHRRHIQSFQELDKSDWLALQQLINYLISGFGIKGATIFFRFGDTAYTGGSVNHLHLHLVSGDARNDESEPIKALIGFSDKKEDI